MAKRQNQEFLFDYQNYALFGIGIVLIVFGFILMSGGASEDPSQFNAAELYSTRRITIAPFLVILGFIVEIFAIMKKPNKSDEEIAE